MEFIIRSMTKNDWTQVAEIYRQGIETGNAMFESQIPSWDKWNLTHVRSCRVVATIENIVVGWTALIPVSAHFKPENPASIKLHQNHGFRIIGYCDKIGQMKGIWRDTMLLERRSKKIGTQPGALT